MEPSTCLIGATTAFKNSQPLGSSWGNSANRATVKGNSAGPPGWRWIPKTAFTSADWGNERVQIFGPGGDYLAGLRGDSAPSRWAQDYFNANPDEARARSESNLEPDLSAAVATQSDRRREESANIEKLFWGPTSVRLDGRGSVYIVDSLRHRVQIYRWPD